MRVRYLNGDDLEKYHTFLRDAEDGDVLQTSAWARLKGASGWKPHFFVAEDEGEVVGTCLALERRLPRLPFTLFYCPRGPVLDWRAPDALPQMMREVRRVARTRRAVLVKIDPPVPSDTARTRHEIMACGMRPYSSGGFGGIQPRCVMKLDISAGADAAMESFKPKWRYNIRVAERKGVTVREAGEAGMADFYAVLLETARRDGFLVRGRTYFDTMWRELSRDGLIRLFLTEYEGKVISGALMYVMGKQAWYTYGASSNEHRNVMPNHLMQWRMIQSAAEAGCTVYHFRGVSCKDEPDSDDHLQGLNRFKAGFNAEFVEYAGEFDLPVSRPLYVGWTRLAPAAMKLLKMRAQAEGD